VRSSKTRSTSSDLVTPLLSVRPFLVGAHLDKCALGVTKFRSGIPGTDLNGTRGTGAAGQCFTFGSVHVHLTRGLTIRLYFGLCGRFGCNSAVQAPKARPRLPIWMSHRKGGGDVSLQKEKT